MAWASSALSTTITVVSKILQYNNLRIDLVTGKFWDASDGTETQGTTVAHDATRGSISTSTGSLRILPRGAAHYLEIDHNGSNLLFDTNTGFVGFNNNVAIQSAYNFTVYNATNDKGVRLSHDGTNPWVQNWGTGSGNLILAGGATNFVQIGVGTGESAIYMWDAGGGPAAWVKCTVNAGAWVFA